MEQITRLVAAGHLSEAQAKLERFLGDHPHDGEALRLLAKLELTHGNAVRALEIMGQAAQLLPHSGEIQYELGVIHLQLADMGAAETAFIAATQLEPALADAHYNLGCLYRVKQQKPEARAAFSAALTAAPDHAKAWFNLGNIQLEEGEFLPAIEAYDRAMADASLKDRILVNLGLAYRLLGRLDEAEHILAQALAADPTSALAHNRLGLVAADRGRFELAIDHFRQALILAPDDPEATTGLARALVKAGDPGQAVDIAQTALARTDVTTRSMVDDLTTILSYAGRPELAASAIERVLDADPTDRAAAASLNLMDVRLERKFLIDLEGGSTCAPAPPHGLDRFAAAMTEKIEMQDGKNLLWFNTKSSRKQDKSHFLVLTSGNCGAIWFASALNLNEEIFASCGIDHPIESCFRYNMQKDGVKLLRSSNPHHYRNGADPQVMGKVFTDHNLNYTVTPRQYHKLGWFVFDELEDLPGSRDCTSIGNVHGLIASQFARFYMRDPTLLGDRRVIVANMIRHPLPRIESSIKAFINYHVNDFKDVIDNYIADNRTEMHLLEKQYGISLEDPRVRSVIYMYRIGRTVKWVADELHKFRFMTALKMEDLQSSPEYFSKAVAFLTDGRITADQGHLSKVYQPENLGVGRRGDIPDGTRPPDARSQWEQWSDWERAEFRVCCRRDDIERAYAPFDYDFSFVT